MTDLEVCRLGAEALGKHAVEYNGTNLWVFKKWPDPNDNGGVEMWNPLTDAEQRWECVEWLRKYGQILIGSAHHHKLSIAGVTVSFYCEVKEFPARAVAELQRRKNDQAR